MPSYTQYMRQMAVMDANDDDIESWITVKGNHIPIKKGQSKEDAVKEFISKKSDKEFSKRAEKPQSIGEATKKVVSQVKENREINKAAKKEYPAEFETVRKNAKANPYLYDLRYTQKSKSDAYKQYKADTEKKESPKSNKQVFYKNISGKQIGSPKGRTFIENEIMTEKEMAKYGFDPSDKRFERKELGKNDHHFFFGARFENKKEELPGKKENGRYERPVHISEPLKDVVAETKAKTEKEEEKPADLEKRAATIGLKPGVKVQFADGTIKEVVGVRSDLVDLKNNGKVGAHTLYPLEKGIKNGEIKVLNGNESKGTKEKEYNTEGLYQDALNELDDQIADKEKELENIHLAMTQNAEAGYFDIANSNMMDIEFVEGQLKELKKKREKLAGSEKTTAQLGKK